MTEYTQIIGIFRADVGDVLFDELIRICPEGRGGRQGHAFRVTLRSDDPRLGRLLGALAAAGLTPQREFDLRLSREYDAADLAPCEYLELLPLPGGYVPSATERGGKDGRGRLIVREDDVPDDKGQVLFGMRTWFFVHRRVKETLAAGRLGGLTFRPTYFGPSDMTAEDTDERIEARHGVPYWEIDAEPTMPPLCPHMTVVDSVGRPVDTGRDRYDDGFFRRDGAHWLPELHYRRSDLGRLPAGVDVARTYETFGNGAGRHGRGQDGQPFDQPLVVSRRFYEFCLAHGVRTGWVPVRVDPE